jgi:hypothetical protein
MLGFAWQKNFSCREIVYHGTLMRERHSADCFQVQLNITKHKPFTSVCSH